MKRTIALLCALVLIFLCGCASAQTPTFKGKAIKFEDFSLKMDSGVPYVKKEHTEGSFYLTVYPNVKKNDTFSYIEFVYAGELPDMDAKYWTKERLDHQKEQWTKAYAQSDVKITGMKYLKPRDSKLAGAVCVILENSAKAQEGRSKYNLYRRQFYMVELGYVINLVSDKKQNLDAFTKMLEKNLTWE